jgi:hypothetical protein
MHHHRSLFPQRRAFDGFTAAVRIIVAAAVFALYVLVRACCGGK